MSIKELVIENIRLIDGAERPVHVIVSEGKVSRIIDSGQAVPEGTRIDGTERFLLPGMVDLHIQGAGGADCLHGTPEAMAQISRAVAAFGTTGWLATTVYDTSTDNRHLKEAVRSCGRELGGAKALGIHLEGPFINPAKKGMISPDCITPVDENILDEIFTLCGGTLKMMTIAPELPGALKIIEKLAARGVVASFGHSDADFARTKDGIAAGITHVTHLFNAMRSMGHRSPGPIPALVQAEGVTVQFIPDGAHIEPPMAWLVGKLLPPARLCLITDGLESLGRGDSDFVYKGRAVSSRNGVVRYHDGTLVGTGVGLSELAGRFAQFSGWTIPQAVRAASVTPLSVLGLAPTSRPLIEVGNPADLVIAEIENQTLQIFTTLVDGRVVYSRGNPP
jgi:N-acetylglucosamine-6-phosphate deacetylase